MEERGFQALLMTGNYVSGNNRSSPAKRNLFYEPQQQQMSILSSHDYPYISSYDFFTKNTTDETSSENFKKEKHIHSVFSHLPGLESMEQMNPLNPTPTPVKTKVAEARSKRRTLSDKTRSLQKVLPWEKKMDMATILEETFKYIKFLEAQVRVLESMPSFESENSNRNPMHGNGELENLNRQQLLEVVVNSPAAQTILYSKGCCIYSLEQLILFKDIAEKNFFPHLSNFS